MARILVMLPNNPGDVLMVTPALRRLKKMGHEVHFLTDADCVDLVRFNPNIDKLHILKRREIKKQLNSNEWHHGFNELKNFAQGLKSESFDKVANCFQGDTTAILAGFLNVDDTTGQILLRNGALQIKDNLTQLLYAIPFARRYAPAHASDFYSLICGAESDGRGTELFLPQSAIDFANSFYAENSLIPEKSVILHHGSAHKKKEWPQSNFAELLKLLSAHGYKAILTGTKKEEESAEAIIRMSGTNALNICGKTAMLESAAIIGKAAHLVSGDTFAMHLAASLNVPLTALFAPTSPLETGPYCEKATVISADCRCYGSYEGSCSLNRSCMATIPAKAVFDIIVKSNPELPSSCTIRKSRFDHLNGLIEYTNGYNSSARQAFSYLASINDGNRYTCSSHEKVMLTLFKETLQKNISVLSRLKTARDNDQIKTLVAENVLIERELNLHNGAGALFAAWLRLQNNSINSNSLQTLAGGFLNNARELSLILESILNSVSTVNEDSKSESNNTIPIFKSAKEAAASALSLQADFVIIADSNVIPGSGAVQTMADMLLHEKETAGCCAKILNSDDNIHHAGYRISGDASLIPHCAGLPRFSRQAVETAFIDSAEPLFILLKREVLQMLTNSTSLRESLLGLKRHNRTLLYCPDAEVYYNNSRPS
ncbi:MAG: glycosyltransferase family 9 protein [Fibrobacteres bacterium]|nr:glycosyltransferase family 9 protein [Fibrobacterota bacterium]